MTVGTSFRDSAWRLSPPRLRTERAAKLVYSMVGLPLDLVAQASLEAAKVGFPLECPADALPYLGRDRGIRRGPQEPEESYRQRLLIWIESWRKAGIGRGMLDQLAGFLTPNECVLRIWTQTGMVYTREADGTFSVVRAGSGVWDWDGHTELWARFWVVIYSVDGVPWERDGTWGDGELWGETVDGTWGSTATINEVEGIRAIVSDWKPAAAVCKNIIVSFDADAFDPTDTSPPLPDGTWGRWGKNVAGRMTRARDDRAIYWRGTAS